MAGILEHQREGRENVDGVHPLGRANKIILR